MAARMADRSTLGTFAGICLLAFVLLLGYEVSRTAVESLFLEAYGHEMLPWAWAVVVPVMGGSVWLYNRFATRVPLFAVMTGALVVSAVSLAALLGLRGLGVPSATFLLYVWKDVHIMILLETVWTFANIVFAVRTARWSYGMFLLMGSAGSVVGGITVGELAVQFGTATSLWASVGLLLALALASPLYGRLMGQATPPRKESPSFVEGLRVLRSSRYVLWMLVLVALVQVVITLVDYEYNAALERAFPDTDARTQAGGRVYSVISGGSAALQLLTGPVLRFVGVPLTLLSIPLLLAVGVPGAVAAPGFSSLATLKVASKVFDYSLFKAAKEILYIPLEYEEKTLGKAVVDMFTYRTAKGGASVLLIGLASVGWAGLVLWILAPLMLAWFAVTLRIVRGFRARISREEEVG
jgi:ATP/ADP translocase